ncbi:hypothetical protein MQC88_12075 [Luteimonas sp. 50]|uniref:Uncharacterized protein n=1 Tax=Cognatiluteimonas sedimenti TaxID=2927791 RepID=A0ABT0A6R4_9GAMM|nr:hypothetical protein [Lysobacter sedimenti]MCJ0826680.1 hypothetical protein [Lysobacter sedimenti]
MTKGSIAMAVAVAIVLGTLGYRLGVGRAQGDELKAIEQRLAAMEARQHKLEGGYLNRTSREELATQLGYHASRGTGPANRARDLEPRPPSRTPQAAAADARQRLQALRQTFDKDPVNARWASNTRMQVEDTIASIVEQGTVVPRAVQTDCRSHSCMISLDLLDSTESDRLSESLLSDLAGILPTATLIEVPSADGKRTELHILATTRKSQSRRTPRG